MGTDDVFAVIAEGTRRHILETLRDGDRAVGELVVELQVSQPTVSKHLKVLREAGLVTMRAQGQKRYYSLDAEPLDHLRTWLAAFGSASSRKGAVVDPGAAGAELTAAGGSVVLDPVDPGSLAGDAPADLLAVAVIAGPVHELEGDSAAGVSTPVIGASDGIVASVAITAQESDVARPIGRTMGRAAERAADLLSQLRRRRDPSS